MSTARAAAVGVAVVSGTGGVLSQTLTDTVNRSLDACGGQTLHDKINVQTLSGEGSPSSGSTRLLEVDVAPRYATAVVEQLRGLIGQIPEHPSLVPVIDVGVTNSRVFIVTPPVPGESLDSALVEYGPAAFGDALPRLQHLADGLDRAAAQGFCHGRLTPHH